MSITVNACETPGMALAIIVMSLLSDSTRRKRRKTRKARKVRSSLSGVLARSTNHETQPMVTTRRSKRFHPDMKNAKNLCHTHTHSVHRLLLQ